MFNLIQSDAKCSNYFILLKKFCSGIIPFPILLKLCFLNDLLTVSVHQYEKVAVMDKDIKL